MPIAAHHLSHPALNHWSYTQTPFCQPQNVCHLQSVSDHLQDAVHWRSRLREPQRPNPAATKPCSPSPVPYKQLLTTPDPIFWLHTVLGACYFDFCGFASINRSELGSFHGQSCFTKLICTQLGEPCKPKSLDDKYLGIFEEPLNSHDEACGCPVPLLGPSIAWALCKILQW